MLIELPRASVFCKKLKQNARPSSLHEIEYDKSQVWLRVTNSLISVCILEITKHKIFVLLLLSPSTD